MYREYIIEEIKHSKSVKEQILSDDVLLNQIDQAAKICVDAYKNGHKILFGGNGGSAADSQHLAGELVSKFYFDRPGLPAIAMTTDSSIMTAIGNDYGYEKLFTRQLQANGNQGDVFIGITTSGSSKNIVEALKYARFNGIRTICFNGKDGGIIEASGLADINIIVPSKETPRIQESHIMIGHILCAIIEREMFK